jgi:hypothetical protein
MINQIPDGHRKKGESAFIYLYIPTTQGVNVGIVDATLKGFTPSGFSIKSSVNEKERQLFLNELNNTVFGINEEKAIELMLQSMQR